MDQKRELTPAEHRQRVEAARARWMGHAEAAAAGAATAVIAAQSMNVGRRALAARALEQGKTKAAAARQKAEAKIARHARAAARVERQVRSDWPLPVWRRHLGRESRLFDQDASRRMEGLVTPEDVKALTAERMRLNNRMAAASMPRPVRDTGRAEGGFYVAGQRRRRDGKRTAIPARLQGSMDERLAQGWVEPRHLGARQPLVFPTGDDLREMRREVRDSVDVRRRHFDAATREKGAKRAGEAAAEGVRGAQRWMRRIPKVGRRAMAVAAAGGALAGLGWGLTKAMPKGKLGLTTAGARWAQRRGFIPWNVTLSGTQKGVLNQTIATAFKSPEQKKALRARFRMLGEKTLGEAPEQNPALLAARVATIRDAMHAADGAGPRRQFLPRGLRRGRTSPIPWVRQAPEIPMGRVHLFKRWRLAKAATWRTLRAAMRAAGHRSGQPGFKRTLETTAATMRPDWAARQYGGATPGLTWDANVKRAAGAALDAREAAAADNLRAFAEQRAKPFRALFRGIPYHAVPKNKVPTTPGATYETKHVLSTSRRPSTTSQFINARPDEQVLVFQGARGARLRGAIKQNKRLHGHEDEVVLPPGKWRVDRVEMAPSPPVRMRNRTYRTDPSTPVQRIYLRPLGKLAKNDPRHAGLSEAQLRQRREAARARWEGKVLAPDERKWLPGGNRDAWKYTRQMARLDPAREHGAVVFPGERQFLAIGGSQNMVAYNPIEERHRTGKRPLFLTHSHPNERPLSRADLQMADSHRMAIHAVDQGRRESVLRGRLRLPPNETAQNYAHRMDFFASRVGNNRPPRDADVGLTRDAVNRTVHPEAYSSTYRPTETAWRIARNLLRPRLRKAAPTDPTDSPDDGSWPRDLEPDEAAASPVPSPPATSEAERSLARRLAALFRLWLEQPRRLGDEAAIAEALTKPLEDAMLAGVRSAQIPPDVGGLPGVSDPDRVLAFSFERRNPEVQRRLEQYSLGRIRAISAESRDAIRAAIIAGAQMGLPVEEQAHRLRDSIGLSPGQNDWVASYRRQLETLDPRVLTRALRDRRHDGPITRAIDTNTPLSAEDIERYVGSYHRRALAYRAMTIARTEALRGANTGMVETARVALLSMPDMTVEKVWIATKDSRTRDAHRELDGKVVQGLDEPFTYRNPTTGALEQIRWPHDDKAVAHQVVNCLLPGARVVAPNIRAVSRREYDGEAIRIQTRRGAELACTINHPILTDRGWVAAQFLQEGDRVVRSAADEWNRAVDDDQHAPPRIEDIYDALNLTGLARLQVCRAVDFHHEGMHGQVRIVLPDGELRGHQHVAAGEPAGDLALLRGLLVEADCRRGGLLREVLGAPLRAADGSVRGAYLSFAGALAHLAPFEPLGLTACSKSAAMFGEDASDDLARDPVLVREALDRLAAVVRGEERADLWRLPALAGVPGGPDNAGLTQDPRGPIGRGASLPGDVLEAQASTVELDDVVLVTRFPWRGHVFNLETDSRLYIANGIVNHNCRCSFGLRLIPKPGAGRFVAEAA